MKWRKSQLSQGVRQFFVLKILRKFFANSIDEIAVDRGSNRI